MDTDYGWVLLALLETIRKIEVARHVDVAVLELNASHITTSKSVGIEVFSIDCRKIYV
jgi:hypothetical protein